MKRLKLSNDKKLAGVCGGVAEYLGIDPVLIRAAWILVLFMGGTGLLAYLILWLLMPSAES